MKYVFAVVITFAFAAHISAQWVVTDRNVWVVTDRGVKLSEPEPRPPLSEYQKKQAEAIEKGTPLVIFVGTSGREIKGYLRCDVPGLEGVKAPAILTAKVKDGQLYWHETLPATAADARIRGEVQARPIPFDLSPLPLIADADGKGHGPWPKQFEFPEGFERYTPARYTQSIFTLNSSPAIDRVPRSALLAKWHQPGGLEGVSKEAWRSDVYRKIPGGVHAFQARLPVKNSFGFFQQELGWTRQYPDGTQFMDVLSNRDTGEVFEIRLRSKRDGKWNSEVDFRNRAHRPAGYQSVRLSDCNSCHAEAGTGGYAVGLVPGGDTVISDPFESLER